MKVNRVIMTLIYSDLIIYSALGLVAPIIAVFWTDKIQGGNVEIAGIAAMIYFLVKSILQLPIARYVDKSTGEDDDYWVMMWGNVVIALSFFLYVFASQVWHVYALQAMHGVGAALSYPSWQAIFTRHIDRHEEGFEWSLYYTAVDMGTAISAAAGGFLALKLGYQWLFFAVGVLNVFGIFLLFAIRKAMRKVT